MAWYKSAKLLKLRSLLDFCSEWSLDVDNEEEGVYKILRNYNAEKLLSKLIKLTETDFCGNYLSIRSISIIL